MKEIIFEKLKLDEEPLSTYKTTAHVTFSNAIVFKGVIELDSEYLRVEKDFCSSSRKVKPDNRRDSSNIGSDLSFVIDNDAADGPFDADKD